MKRVRKWCQKENVCLRRVALRGAPAPRIFRCRACNRRFATFFQFVSFGREKAEFWPAHKGKPQRRPG